MVARTLPGGRWKEELFWGVILLWAVLPLWMVGHVPNGDGPAHEYTAFLLRKLGGADAGILSRVFEADPRPWPNWISTVLLMVFQPLLGWAVAEKLLLTLVCLSCPLAFRYLLVRFGVASPLPALMVLPLVHHHLVYLGFFNYTFGLALMLAVVGYVAGRDRWTRVGWAGLCLLGLVLYFCHPIPWILGCLFGGLVVVADPVGRFRRTACYLAAWIPSAALMVWYLKVSPPVETGARTGLGSLVLNGGLLAAALPFPDGWSAGAVLFFVLSVVLAGGLVLCKGGREGFYNKTNLLLVLVLFSAALAVAAPDKTGGGSLIQYRLTLVPWLFLLAWLGIRLVDHPGILRIQGGVAIVVALVLGLRLAGVLVEFQQPAAEYDALLDRVPAQSTLMVVTSGGFRESEPLRTGPWEHAALGVVSSGKQVAVLNHYQGRAHGFPVRFRPGMDPHSSRVYPELGGDPLDLAAYERASGFYPDCLLLMGGDGVWKGVGGYEFVARTPGYPAAALWVRKPESGKPLGN